jgi:hypothetical protein
VTQVGLFQLRAAPFRGECTACLRAPLPVFRINVIIEDAQHHVPYTQLLCETCLRDFTVTLLNRSVEPTPQFELDALPFEADVGWPRALS